MSRFVCLLIAVVSLLPVTALAQAVHKPRPPARWHGYGFLPGYHQPLSNSLPLFKQDPKVLREARREQRHWYIDPVPEYYGYDGNRYYFGRPGFDYGGRYNGGSFGPCYTRTPIGPIWNCG